MLRKRTRSVQKDQQQMSHHNNLNHQLVSECGSESFSNSEAGNKNPKNSSFYTIPGLLVGLSPKGFALTDCDSVRSPTSPLDFRLFAGLGNPFRSSPTRPFSHENGQQRSYVGGGASKLGLISIIDSVVDDGMKFSGKVLRSSSSSSSESSKNIILGPQLRVFKAPNGTNSFDSPKSLPKNYPIFPHSHSSKPKSPLQENKASSDVLFEIGDSPLEPDSFGKIRSCSLDSYRTISNHSGLRNNSNNPNPNKVTTQVDSPPKLTETQLSGSDKPVTITPGSILGSSSGNGLGIGSLSATEIELSEDYTCVISHGPNPKTTHIFGDCILETHSNDLVTNFGNSGLSHPITTTTNNPTSEIISVPFPSDHFLSFCYSCNKKLEDGKDIYIYRGEKAFCSLNCRSLEILIDEELEKDGDDEEVDSDEDDYGKELFF